MSTTTQTTINGYAITLELFTEGGNARSECYVEKGAFSASLEAAEGGTLTDARGNEQAIAERDTTAIRQWAEDNGY